MEKAVVKRKNSGYIISIILLFLVIIGMMLYIMYDKGLFNTDVSENNSGDEAVVVNEVSEETKGQLKKLLGISSNEADLAGAGFDIQSILYKHNGLMSELSANDKVLLIYRYAFENDMLIKVTGDEYSMCSSGSNNFCFGISESIYEKISALFGINDNFDTLYTNQSLDKYNDLYLHSSGGTCIMGKIKHNLTFSYDGDDIKVVDDYAAIDYKGCGISDASVFESNEATYTFKLKDSKYYLYSISQKN